MTNFNPLIFIANHAGMNLADAIKEAYEQGKRDAQPERKRGKWEIYIISMLDGEGCKCSECGFEGAPYWDYCPNCGSYNGGEQDESI